MTIQTNIKGVLNEEVQRMCLEDPELLAKVAVVSGKRVAATLRMLERNISPTLASVFVVRAIADYTGKTEEQILINESSRN